MNYSNKVPYLKHVLKMNFATIEKKCISVQYRRNARGGQREVQPPPGPASSEQ